VVVWLRSIWLAGSVRSFALGAERGQTAGLMNSARHASDAQMDAATWRFTTEDARIKLTHLYPTAQG
jgi:hypothetical protein